MSREHPGRASRYGSLEHRERLARGRKRFDARQRELQAITPADLVAARKGQLATPATKRLLDIAAETMLPIYRAAGNGLSPQREVQLGVAHRVLGLALVENNRALQGEGNGEAASRAGTLFQRFGALVREAVGLDVERVAPDLATYLREQRAQGGNGRDPDPDAHPAADRHSAAPGEALEPAP